MRSIMPSLVCHVNACPCLSSFLWLLLHSLHSLQIAGGLRHAPLTQDLRPVHADARRSSILPLTVNCRPRLPFARMVSMYVHWSSGTITSAVAHTCPQLSHLRCLLIAFSLNGVLVSHGPCSCQLGVALRALHQKSGCRTEKRPQASCHASVACSSSENGPCICLAGDDGHQLGDVHAGIAACGKFKIST